MKPQFKREEIPDPTIQLQADKAEFLEALEILRGELTARTPEKIHDMTDSLIQKHKQ